jgi:hypothetical protein
MKVKTRFGEDCIGPYIQARFLLRAFMRKLCTEFEIAAGLCGGSTALVEWTIYPDQIWRCLFTGMAIAFGLQAFRTAAIEVAQTLRRPGPLPTPANSNEPGVSGP